jgi:cytochrome P450
VNEHNVRDENEISGVGRNVKRAECPVTKLDFVNLVATFGGLASTEQSQPTNGALLEQGTVRLGDAVMVNTRALVDEVLRNPGLYSSENLIEQGNTLPLIPLNIDPPDHVGYRKLLDPLFAPRRIDALEADIAERVNHFIDAFIDRGSCDFTAEFAELFPSSVFLGMMGLPWEELDTLVSMRDGLLRPGDHGMEPEERSAIQRETAVRVYAYFDAILDTRAADPQKDILTLFVSLEGEEGRLAREEVLAICFVLLTAGLDTVTDSLTCFFAFLAQNPKHRRRIVENPDMIPSAVEELLRWETPVPSVVRWAREDATLGGEKIGAGNHVMVNLGAANLDPATFEAPMEVRFDREVNRHLAFGGGVHRCLGSHLARRELRIALREWHRRIPDYGLASEYTVNYLPPLRYVPDLQLTWPT